MSSDDVSSEDVSSDDVSSDDARALGLDPWLLSILRCPLPHHAPLDVDAVGSALVCRECGRVYPVRDGLPVLLVEEAQHEEAQHEEAQHEEPLR